MNAIEIVFDFFEDHIQAALAADQKRPLALGVLGFALGALSFYVAMAVSGRLEPLPFGWMTLGMTVIWELVMGFALVATLHLVAEMGGAKGSASELFVLFGLSDLIWALAVPAALVFMALFPRSNWLLGLVFLVVGALNLGYRARSLQDTYRLSAGRAWVTLFLPYLATLAASVLAFALLMASLFIRVMKALS